MTTSGTHKMKIVFIIPGSGGSFYCENCLRDRPLIRAMRRQGAEVLMLPLYMPLFEDSEKLEGEQRLICGAISSSLRQSFPLLRNHGPLLGRILDSKPLLRLAARLAGTTRSKGLEKMTLSMIEGAHLLARDELAQTVELINAFAPHVIHISNALLIGLGQRLRQLTRTPLLCCSVQDEHTWIDAMREPWKSECLKLLIRKCAQVDVFISVSEYYRAHMSALLSIDPAKIEIVYPPVEAVAQETTHDNAASDTAPVIGYLSRLCEAHGLERLIDAWLYLRNEFPSLQLRIAGGYTGDDRVFVGKIIRRLGPYIKSGAVRLLPNLHKDDRSEFFHSMTLLSVPQQAPSAFGYYLLEAMARGIPVVQPNRGAFPEIVGTDKNTSGGIIYDDSTVEGLRASIENILRDRTLHEKLSRAAIARCETLFPPHHAAQRTIQILQRHSAPEKMLLQVKDIYRSYRSDSGMIVAEVLRGLSFGVREGECVAILGPSGSGKTTLLNIISALDRPDEGSVLFMGESVFEWDESQRDLFRSAQLGIVFQEHLLLPQLTVSENVMLAASAPDFRTPGAQQHEYAAQLLSKVGLSQKSARYPGELSTGERQRAALVRALVRRPRLIVADEPTGSLDSENSNTVAELLVALVREMRGSLLMVTHSQELAAKMDRSLLLRDGRLAQ